MTPRRLSVGLSVIVIVEVPRVSLKELKSTAGESSETVARRIAAARAIQHERCGRINALLGAAALCYHCHLDGAGRELLDRAIERLGVSARGVAGLLKVARTIADLQGSEWIRAAHLAEALQYRAQASPSPLL